MTGITVTRVSKCPLPGVSTVGTADRCVSWYPLPGVSTAGTADRCVSWCPLPGVSTAGTAVLCVSWSPLTPAYKRRGRALTRCAARKSSGRLSGRSPKGHSPETCPGSGKI